MSERKFILSPSVLSADFANLKEQLDAVNEAEFLHLDVMDGNFVPNITFGPIIIKAIRKLSNQVLDTHLMIDKPERYIEDFAKAGADIITIHYESTDKVEECLDLIHSLGKKTGLSVKPKTDFADIIPYLDKVDMILIMTVEPGFGGQKYIEEMTEKISVARANFAGDIEVDGGVSCDNLKKVLDAGANVVVAGSAVFGKDDIKATVREFYKIAGE